MGLSFLNFKHSHPIALNAYLNRLIIGALVPLLIFFIFMMVLFARQEQASRRRGLESTSRALVLAVDQEILAVFGRSGGATHVGWIGSRIDFG